MTDCCAWCGEPLEDGAAVFVDAALDRYCSTVCATEASYDPGYYDRMVDENEGLD